MMRMIGRMGRSRIIITSRAEITPTLLFWRIVKLRDGEEILEPRAGS